MRSLLYTVAAVAILSQVDGKFKCVYEGLFENSKLNKRGPFLHFYIFDAMKENCTYLLLANNYIRCYPSYKKGKLAVMFGKISVCQIIWIGPNPEF